MNNTLAKVMVIIGVLLALDSIGSFLLGYSLFYEFYFNLVAWWKSTISDEVTYLKVVPVEPAIMDYRFLLLVVGIILSLVGRFFLSPAK